MKTPSFPSFRSAAAWLAACMLMLSVGARAQAPEHETKQISDNVYVYRHGGHQAMFIVTPKEVRLPKYEKWANYERYLPGNVERFCGYWGRGIDG